MSAELKNESGGRIVFHGGIDARHVLPFATPDEVRVRVRDVLTAMAGSGGYIFAPSQILAADIPAENIIAMYDKVKRFPQP